MAGGIGVGGKGISVGFGGSGGGSFDPETTQVVRKILTHTTTGADNHLITTSGNITQAQILSIVTSNFVLPDDLPLAIPEHLNVTVACCGGGGSGSYGSSTGYGAFPGVVRKVKFRLSDFPVTPVPYTIGAGGVNASTGGFTVFGSGVYQTGPNPFYFCYAFGGLRGGNNESEEQAFHSSIEGLRGRENPLPRRAFAIADDGIYTMHNWYGPGGGGNNATGKPIAGGYGSLGGPYPTVGGNAAAAGANHNALYFDSWGAGGGGSRTASVPGGNGGFPGGGGGSSITGNIPGNGGNGAIKMQFELEYVGNV